MDAQEGKGLGDELGDWDLTYIHYSIDKIVYPQEPTVENRELSGAWDDLTGKEAQTPMDVFHQAPLSMDSPGKNPGVGGHFLQGPSPNPGIGTRVSCIVGTV